MEWVVDAQEPLTIVAAFAGGDQICEFAASELRRYVAKMTGTAPAIVRAWGPARRPAVRLELSPQAGLEDDDYRIHVHRDEVALTAASPRGLLYAVYTLLEHLGCRWIHPREDEQIVPRCTRLTLAGGTYTYVPRLEHRGLALYGLYAETMEMGRRMIDWMAENRLNLLVTARDERGTAAPPERMWPPVAEALLPELRRRGIVLGMSAHAARCCLPSAQLAEHPPWLALVNGAPRPVGNPLGPDRARVRTVEGSQGAYYFEHKMADHCHWATNVWWRPHYAVEITRHAVDAGFRGIVALFLPITTWWHSSLNVYFCAKACWHEEIDVDAELDDYVQNYFDRVASKVQPIFRRIVHELHDPALLAGREYGSADDWTTDADAVRRMIPVAEELLAQLDIVALRVDTPHVAKRIRRLRTYMEYFLRYHHYRAMPAGLPRETSFDRLHSFLRQHAGEDLGVCVSPDFLYGAGITSAPPPRAR